MTCSFTRQGHLVCVQLLAIDGDPVEYPGHWFWQSCYSMTRLFLGLPRMEPDQAVIATIAATNIHALSRPGPYAPADQGGLSADPE